MNAWQALFAAVFGSLTVAPVASRLLASTVTEAPPPGPTAEESYAAWADRHRAFVADLERRAAAGEDVTRPTSPVERGSVGRALVAAATAVNARAIVGSHVMCGHQAVSGPGIPEQHGIVTAEDGGVLRVNMCDIQAGPLNMTGCVMTVGRDYVRVAPCPDATAQREEIHATGRGLVRTTPTTNRDEYADLVEATRRLHRKVRDIEHNHQRLKRNAPTLPPEDPPTDYSWLTTETIRG